MGKAEVGSTKWLSNNMKSKGLQRLRWYCQVCERQMRDENGFKQHCLSEAHNRNMQLVGENSKKFISNYSDQFKRDFLRLLRTAHGEKKVHANHFYQEYISDKEHVHMNATRWPSLTEFVKYLGREGICRVEEGERGMEIAWIDDSPEALRRREAVAKKDRQARGDEEREIKLLEAQIQRAQEQKREQSKDDGYTLANGALEKKSDAPVTFKLGAVTGSSDMITKMPIPVLESAGSTISHERDGQEELGASVEVPKPVIFSLGNTSKTKPLNVFSSKNSSHKQDKPTVMAEPKKMSALEKVMLADKEEQERKRQRGGDRSGNQPKRIRL